MKWVETFCIFLTLSPLAVGEQGNWTTVGNDSGYTKYSTLTQITPANVTKLVKKWSYETGDPAGGFRGWEITPIVVDNVMYFPTTGKKVIALNAETGQEIWKVDLTQLGVNGAGHKYGCAYWPGDGKAKPRIVLTTGDGYLIQLDAKTGELFKGVGKDGLINLNTGMTEKYGGVYEPGQEPAIYKNLAIFASASGEQGRYGVAGDPRAFDLTTGKEVWRFHSVPQPGDPNFGTWGPDGWQDRRGPGSWVPLTVDVPNGLVYIAFGNPTDQNFGGSRPGKDLYGCSIVALDAETGKLKWYFQVTHHDIDDWDVSAPPVLVDVKKDGKVIPAIAQTTKVGYLYILNRLTGEAVFGVEERPVPASDAPGEQTSPTQPYPLKPGPIARVSMTREEVSKISPETKKDCLAQYDKAVQMGPNTPYLMVPSLVFPSSEGGPSWGGPAFDPKSGLIIINSRNLGTLGVLQPMRSSNSLDSYAKRKIPFEDKEGYPCSAPPWGELMAIDANTADTVWRVPLGEYKELTKRGIPKTGVPNAAGPIVTASGLIFIGGTSDLMFRAFDEKSGKELWSTQLSNNAVATPMTYQTSSGKQFVAAVVSSGLDNFNIPKVDAGTDKIVVFGLP